MLDPHRQSTEIPEETAKLAKRIFRKKNSKGRRYLLLRDRLGVLFEDEAFGHLFSTQGQPALSPGMLVMVQVLAFCEGLSDRQAADTVASRIDWKYLLGLPLAYEGFDASVLSEFRQRLVNSGEVEVLLLDRLLSLCKAEGVVKARGKQRTDSTRVLAAVRTLNRLELAVETLSHTLEVLATVAAQWMQSHLDAAWFERYGEELHGWRWPDKGKEQETLVQLVGSDGFRLLDALYTMAQEPATDQASTVSWLYQLEAVQTLRQVWLQQYHREEDRVRWRMQTELPPVSIQLQSPHDVEARWSYKRKDSWVGYKVHITESCEPDAPHLITDVQTRPSGEADLDALPAIHTALAQRGLLPAEQLVDAGYLTSKTSLRSEEQYGIELVGQIEGDTSWQARQSPAYAKDNFAVDWEERQATCPQGKVSHIWSEGKSREGYKIVRIRFPKATCAACPVREQCTQGKARTLQLLRPEAQYQRLQEPDFWAAYRARSGIEGSISFAVRMLGMRRTRYVGMANVHMQNVLIAVATNLLRLSRWFAGDKRSRTRKSKLLALSMATCT